MGFLSSLLPTVVGLGVGAMTGNPMLGAAAAGGLGYARTGSLGKGLMAGLAGYGGANLGQALASQGMQDAAIQAGIQQQAAENAGFRSVQDLSQPVFQPSFEPAAPHVAPDTAAMTENLGKYMKEYEALNKVPTGMAGLESAGRGLSSLGTTRGWSDLASNLGGAGGTAKTAMMALSPALTQAPEMPGQSVGDSDKGQRYAYNPNTATPMPTPDVPGYGNLGQDFGRQQRYFTPSYTKISDEEAKRRYGFAGGGPVEEMSISAALGRNTGYPQANIRRGAYATPWQTPISRNMLTGAADVGVNPISGEMNFADGGMTKMPGYYDMIESPVGGEAAAPSSSSSPSGQGVSSGLAGLGLGMMSIADSVPGLSTGVLGALGAAIADSQAASMSNANAALSAMSSVPGITTVSDENGNVFGISSPESIAAADTAIAADAAAAAAAAAEGSSGAVSGAAGVGGVSGGDGGTSGGTTGGTTGGTDGGVGGGVGGGDGEAAGGLLRRKYATGGLSSLGSYSDGGRLLRGPGDGVSDSIPAVIGRKQPARLADGEFVVPARIVSELGNGSTEAGARKLYAMMDRVQKARGKTVGKNKVARNTRADKYLPA